jgi:hypothetical protein
MNIQIKLRTTIPLLTVTCLCVFFAKATLAQEGSSMKSYAPKTSDQSNSANKAAQARQEGGVIVATAITPQDAAKKYPARNGRYPMGERDPHKASGIVSSPYPPHTDFDCSNIAHGSLVLDPRANKVFVRP